jgi:transmembrane sensor
MAQVSEHHQYLFLGKITGSLSGEEERELNELFARDATAVQAYESLIAQLPAGQVAGSFRHLDAPGFWKNISGDIRQQQALRRTRKLRKTGGVVTIVAVLAIGIWRLAPGPKRDPTRIAAYQMPAGSVELRLANGSTVDLSKTKGKLQKDQLILENDDSGLSYQATGQPDGGASAATAIGLNSITVPATMDYKLTLADGSEIWLNSASTVSFPTRFAAGTREISITGEAWCRIAKHPGQPFIIHLPGNTVQVTGTEFNIDTYDPATVKVALVSGGANLLAGAAKIKLDPGYEGISAKGKITLEPFDARKVLSWREGIYYFDGAGLDDLSQVLGRWFGIKTQLDDPVLADKKFVGALYKHRSINSFLDNLKAISHIDSYFDSRGVLHFTAGR